MHSHVLTAVAALLTLAVGPVPPGRSAHALVYDQARRETLAFGGAGEASAELWAWNGATWIRRATEGPGARQLPALAYDVKRQRTVLHGGRTGRGTLNDTWEWDGRAWTRVDTPGPPAREHAQMAYDKASARIVLFGGVGADDRSFADTWAYDGSSWTKLGDVSPGQAPRQRAIHGLVFDDARGALLMVASDLSARSEPNGLFPTEVWEWKDTTWTRLSADGPPLSPVQSVAANPDGGLVLLNADVPGGTAALWTWRLGRWSRVTVDGPSTRFGAALTTDTDRRVVVMFGGETRDHQRLLEDTWEWNGVSWRHGT